MFFGVCYVLLAACWLAVVGCGWIVVVWLCVPNVFFVCRLLVVRCGFRCGVVCVVVIWWLLVVGD